MKQQLGASDVGGGIRAQTHNVFSLGVIMSHVRRGRPQVYAVARHVQTVRFVRRSWRLKGKKISLTFERSKNDEKLSAQIQQKKTLIFQKCALKDTTCRQKRIRHTQDPVEAHLLSRGRLEERNHVGMQA